jgi:hypothetical protein
MRFSQVRERVLGALFPQSLANVPPNLAQRGVEQLLQKDNALQIAVRSEASRTARGGPLSSFRLFWQMKWSS